MDIQLSFRNGQLQFRPGDWLEGHTSWNLSTPPQSIEVRLLWFTQGKGNRDMHIVEKVAVQTNSAMGDAPFRFRLPEAPYSFSGTLVSLAWAVETVAFPSQKSAHIEFVLSSTGQEILLPRIEQPTRKKPFFGQKFVSQAGSRTVERHES